MFCYSSAGGKFVQASLLIVNKGDNRKTSVSKYNDYQEAIFLHQNIPNKINIWRLYDLDAWKRMMKLCKLRLVNEINMHWFKNLIKFCFPYYTILYFRMLRMWRRDGNSTVMGYTIVLHRCTVTYILNSDGENAELYHMKKACLNCTSRYAEPKFLHSIWERLTVRMRHLILTLE